VSIKVKVKVKKKNKKNTHTHKREELMKEKYKTDIIRYFASRSIL